MTKLTQAQQAKADRKAEALARRVDRAAGIETVTEQNTRLYGSVKIEKPAKKRTASILRRLEGRLANLRTLGQGFNDAHLFLLQALAANYTNDELLAKYQGQTSIIWKLDAQIMEFFGLTQTVVEGMNDDPSSPDTTPFGAWFIDSADAPMVKEYINQLVADYKAA